MARKEQPEQRKARVKSGEGQVPNPGQKVNGNTDHSHKKS